MLMRYAYGQNQKSEAESLGYQCKPQRLLWPSNNCAYDEGSIMYLCIKPEEDQKNGQ